MKTPESPRVTPAPQAESPPAESREGRIVPRYVQAPALREHGRGPRNLFWGVTMLFVALVLLVAAILLAGAKVMLSVLTCLLTFTALFVLARLHIFRQRNGGFLAVAVVCLIGAGIPLAEMGFRQAQTWAATRPTQSAPVVALHSAEPEAPLLTQAFALTAPQGDGKQVKVLRDYRVTVGDKPYRVKAGDRFPFLEAKGSQTTFAVRDFRVSLPSDAAEILDPGTLSKGVAAAPSPAAPGDAAASASKASGKSNATEEVMLAEITRSAQQEAMHRYPALAIKDSLENAMFISTYKQLRESPGGDEFFANPEWPIELAELLAKREGWNRGGAPITTGPAPVLDPPAEVPRATRAPANLPPVDSLDAGAGLPGGRNRGR